MLGVVIFDFDGVITDSEILHFRTFNLILAQYNIEITLQDYYKSYLGLSDLDFFKLLVDKGTLKIPHNRIEDLIKQKNKVFETLAKTEGKIIEGVREFLKMLHENNIPMAICSGALLTEIELVLQQANLRSFFKVIVSAEQIKKGKPHPDCFLLTLQKLNERRSLPLLPCQCVVIEDSYWGLQAAKAAKMHTIAVTNSYDASQLALAEKIVTHLNKLSMTDLQQLCN
jgi:beta-phosphoglucomutase